MNINFKSKKAIILGTVLLGTTLSGCDMIAGMAGYEKSTVAKAPKMDEPAKVVEAPKPVVEAPVVEAPKPKPIVPEALEGTTLADVKLAKELFDKGVLFVDSRVMNEFAEGHVKDALNITYNEKSKKSADFDPAEDEFDLTKLPADKEVSIVVYCNAGECWKSYKAAKVMVANGHTSVYWFRDGFPAWKSAGHPSVSLFE